MPNFNIDKGISAYKNSKYVKHLQQQFLNNERPASCVRCWNDEDAGLESKRLIDYKNNKDYLDTVDLDNAGYSIIGIAFNNLCNLACRICGPWASSTWVAESKAGKLLQWSTVEDNYQDLLEFTKNAQQLEIVGGEPFLKNFDEHKEYLKSFVGSSQSEKIRIHYLTNGTIFPDESFLALWDHFEHIDITLSIDDTGKRFEYNRYPAEWGAVYDNIKRFQQLSTEKNNISISISYTVSAFTIFYADEFVNWCDQEGLPHPWFGVVSLRDYYHPSILDKHMKNKIKDKLLLSEHSDVRMLAEFLNKDNSKNMDIFGSNTNQFSDYVRNLDRKRNQSFDDTFPELTLQ